MRSVILSSFLLVSLALVCPHQFWAQDTKAAAASQSYSGMYTFLKDGEFVQITVEDAGRVTGFISRFGDGDSDRGAFLDQFFKQGKLEGSKLNFTTDTVHGTWFEFSG